MSKDHQNQVIVDLHIFQEYNSGPKYADNFKTILLDCKIVRIEIVIQSGRSSKCDDQPYASTTIYKNAFSVRGRYAD